MTPIERTDLYNKFKAGTISSGAKQMLIGDLQAYPEKLKHVDNHVDRNKIKAVIAELKKKPINNNKPML